MNSSGSKFFPNSNTNFINNLPYNEIPTREIKSSYSTFRPKFDYSNLQVEKNNIQAKHKELAEKRNKEEMKEFLNEWGMSRAKYLEEIEKKNEIKKLLKFYEKNLPTNPEKNNDYNNRITQSQGQYTENINTHLSNNSPDRYKESRPESNLRNRNPQAQLQDNEDMNIPNNIFLSPKKNNDSVVNSPIKMNKNNPKSDDNININSPDGDNIFQIEPITQEIESENFFQERILKPEEENKINKNLIRNKVNVINLDKKNRITVNKEEKKIAMKFTEVNLNKTISIIKQMKTTLEKIPTDKVILMKAQDKVYETRHTWGNLLNVKEIENHKDGYKFHVTPLSLYDNVNQENLEKLEKMEKLEKVTEEKKRPSTGFQFLRSRYNKNDELDNLLKQRKNLSEFLSEKPFVNEEKARKMSYNSERVKSAFLHPNEDKKYSRYYLPSPGFGLLPKPIDPFAKKKKTRAKSSGKKKEILRYYFFSFT